MTVRPLIVCRHQKKNQEQDDQEKGKDDDGVSRTYTHTSFPYTSFPLRGQVIGNNPNEPTPSLFFSYTLLYPRTEQEDKALNVLRAVLDHTS